MGHGAADLKGWESRPIELREGQEPVAPGLHRPPACATRRRVWLPAGAPPLSAFHTNPSSRIQVRTAIPLAWLPRFAAPSVALAVVRRGSE